MSEFDYNRVDVNVWGKIKIIKIISIFVEQGRFQVTFSKIYILQKLFGKINISLNT